MDVYLGVDVGSISTKAAVIDADNRLLAKVYLMTAGQPLEAVRQALASIGTQVAGRSYRVCGAATTGSGRYLIGDVIGADLVINEITAQATAAAIIDPQVDTIFEIGGQDSKYISLEGGVVVDFEMNHACAAGTGSFLEEQAERLGVNIKQQFGQLALSSQSPIRLGERCTVFMESDLLNYQQQGASTEDLAAGLCYSIVSNYINRVVGHRRIGNRIFFQGGTAFNKGVVAAFEKFTGHKITVPPDHEVTGAIGAAALARRHQQACNATTSKFGGFDLTHLEYNVRSFECEHCSNHCEINEVTLPGRDALYYGSRCDRYNIKKGRDEFRDIPNLFAERRKLLQQHANLKPGKIEGRPTVGIPLALSNYQFLPLWGTLLTELGVNVVLSGNSSQEVIRRGVEAVLSTPCFPVKVAHGHVLRLVDQQVDFIWLPGVIGMHRDYDINEHNQACPYVQALPDQIAAALEGRLGKSKLLRPSVRFDEGKTHLLKCLLPLCEELPITHKQLGLALEKAWAAQDAFQAACVQRGREVVASLDGSRRAVVVISRPYNGCDPGVSLDLPTKLRRLGVLPIPMDFLDLSGGDYSDDHLFDNMYWKYGQRILRAGDIVRQNPKLHALYMSNFSCGPDSFLISFFKRLMAPKPCLVLEVDEHSADAGVVTRLEAFLESLSSNGAKPQPDPGAPLFPHTQTDLNSRTLYIPWMGDASHGFSAAFRACGQPSQVIPVSDAKALELGRRVCTGKECLPCILTTGDMLKIVSDPAFDPKTAAFFMPASCGPCRFGMYHCMHRLLLDDLNQQQVPVVSMMQDDRFYEHFKQFKRDPSRLGWCAMVMCETLQKAVLAIRPYERTPGQTDQIYQKWLDRSCKLVEQYPTDKAMVREMELAAADFAAIATDRSHPRPRIGIVGEIYVRQHTFANNNLIRQLESLGAEMALATFQEWMYYCNWAGKQIARRRGRLRDWGVNWIKDRVQRGIEHRLIEPFQPFVKHMAEPTMKEVLSVAEQYIDPNFEGEAILSVGKMIEYFHQGCNGVVNVMPFSCMPSTIVSGVMRRLAPALQQMPTLSISYDGQQDPMLQTRLEAFLFQARAFRTKGKLETGSSRLAAPASILQPTA